jgi:hypothetical protein
MQPNEALYDLRAKLFQAHPWHGWRQTQMRPQWSIFTRNRSYRCGVSVAALSESCTEREDCIQDEQEVISQDQY